ncbi:MAG TPA: PAS domain S-box protein [Rhodocyclaceae bacterium]
MPAPPPDREPVGNRDPRLPLALRWVVLPYAVVACAWILVSDRLAEALFAGSGYLGLANTLKGWAFVAVTSLLLAVLVRRYARAVAAREATLGAAERDKLRALLLLEAIADSSPDAIVAKDNDGRYVLFNRGAAAITGKRAEEVIGRTDEEAFPPEIYGEWLRQDKQVLATDSVATYEQTLKNARGPLTLSITKGPLRDRKGMLRGLFGISRDISARKSVEDELRESQLRFATFFRCSPIGIGISVFESGPFVEVNDAFLEIFGYQREQVIGRTSLELGMWPVVEERAQMMVRLVEQGRVRNFEVTCRRRSGEIGHLLASGEVVELGGRRYFMGMLADVTERKRAEQALREREATLRGIGETLRRSQAQLMTFIKCAPLGIAMFDRDMNYLAVSDRWLADHGQRGADLVGRNHYEVHPDLPERWRRVHREALGGTAAGSDEDEWMRDGERRWLRWTALPWLAEDGSVGGIIISSEDVTASRQAREEVQKLSQAVEQSPESVVITDLEGRIEYVNPAFAWVTGYDREEAIGRKPSMLQSGRTPGATYTSLWAALREGRTWTGEFHNRRKDGIEYTERAIVSPLRNAAGEVTHYLAIKADVTERVRTQEAIKASKELLQRVIDSTPDWIYVKDRQSRFILANDAFARAVGCTPEDLIGRLDGDVLREHLSGDVEAQVARIHALDERAMAGGTVREEHDELVSRQGEVRVFDMFKGPLRDPAGEVYGILTVRRDITERRRNEREQQVLEEQLRQAQKMEVIGHLTGGIAHDFNNILTAIFGFAELAQLSPAAAQDPALPRYLQRIVEAAARARDLVAQLLTFSHTRGPGDETSRIAPIAKEVKALLRSTLPATISIGSAIADDLPDALISPVQLHQILMNLGVNAKDAIGAKGAIEIRAERVRIEHAETCASCHRPFDGDYLVVAVSDTGTGIPPQHLPKIFDPFFSTKEVGRGSGLGLSVLHGIVHSANGHVAVRTQPGAGSEFRVFLPFRPGAAQPSRPREAYPPGSERVAGRVLLVDDEPDILEFMATLLEGIGCQVAAFSSSTEAWRLFQRAPQDVDLVITDQIMPDMTGAELARAMLALRPELPVVLSTGYSTAMDESAARELGIRRLLRKPVPSRVLCDMVAQYLPPAGG